LITLSLLVLFLLVLAGSARYFKAYPHRPLIYLIALPATLSVLLVMLGEHRVPALVLPVLGHDFHIPWPLIPVDILVVGIAVIDLLTLPRVADFAAERHVGHIASIAKNHRATLTVSNLLNREMLAWIRDDVDQDLNPQPKDFIVALKPRSRSVLQYIMRPQTRGAYTLERIYVRVRSRWGLWQRILQYDQSSRVHVYPDLKQLSEYAVLARTNRLSQIGVRRTRRVGQDHEFERLRDYLRDDNFKHIDWRATARRNKMTVKDFQSSQSQRVIFLVDCGRMMANEANGLSLLDHAFNSMLMLSYVALRQGDSVGLLCFSDEISSYVPPRGGGSQMNRLLHACYDRFPRLVESRYDQAFLYLAAHCRKRALVILISNLIDEVNANQIEQYLGSLVGRHLPLGVLLKDHHLFDAVEGDPVGEQAVYRAGAAASILNWRLQVLRDLQSKGVLALDVFPEEMTAPLVNRYLQVKARHLL
jgi:uncharacterized protein (DUF58 family)